MEKILNNYAEFVDAVTSEASKNREAYIARINELYDAGMDVARLNTACDGLCSEAGEFMEIKKKIMYQGKPYTDDNVTHFKKELGDTMWYIMNACIALKVNPYEIIEMNVEKLKSRYPGGNFDVYYSENRKIGDI